MSQSARQFLLVCTVTAVLFGIVSWMIPVSSEPGIWWVRIGALAILVVLFFVYRWVWNRKDLAPDFFAATKHFFEKDGFTFVLGTETINGVCHLLVTFQNRYERDCEASVLVQASERMLAPHKLLPDARVSVACGPAAFGKAWGPWAIPKELRGKSISVDVTASCKYPKGRGKMLRYRAGLNVGTAPQSVVSDSIKLIGALGGFHGGAPARARLLLPEDVISVPVPGPAKEMVIVWKLADQFTGHLQCEAV